LLLDPSIFQLRITLGDPGENRWITLEPPPSGEQPTGVIIDAWTNSQVALTYDPSSIGYPGEPITAINLLDSSFNVIHSFVVDPPQPQVPDEPLPVVDDVQALPGQLTIVL